jgi:hypothetical protein
MVEYAVLVAHNTVSNVGMVAGDALSWASTLDWYAIGYVTLALVLLRMAVRAFKPSRF